MEQPLVSVITVTRNRGDLIGRCIKSIQAQTYPNIEHIIVDGDSNDNTEEVVCGFGASNIHYIKTDSAHSAQMACYDIAFEKANGKYICFLDDDDEYLPTKVEKQVNLIEGLPDDYGLVYCWMTYYDSSTNEVLRIHNPQIKGDVSLDVVEKPAVSGTPTLFIKKDAFLSLGGWVSAEETGVVSDWAFGARFCQHYKVDYVPESLIKVYVNHGHTRMTNAGDYYNNASQKVIKFHKYFLTTYAAVYEKHPERAWFHYEKLMSNYLWQNKYKEAWTYFRKLRSVKPGMKSLKESLTILIMRILRWK